MKNIDLNAVGCVEMNNLEMEETQGGFLGALLGLIVAVATLVVDVVDFFDDIQPFMKN